MVEVWGRNRRDFVFKHFKVARIRFRRTSTIDSPESTAYSTEGYLAYIQKALAIHVKNIETHTGKSLEADDTSKTANVWSSGTIPENTHDSRNKRANNLHVHDLAMLANTTASNMSSHV